MRDLKVCNNPNYDGYVSGERCNIPKIEKVSQKVVELLAKENLSIENCEEALHLAQAKLKTYKFVLEEVISPVQSAPGEECKSVSRY